MTLTVININIRGGDRSHAHEETTAEHESGGRYHGLFWTTGSTNPKTNLVPIMVPSLSYAACAEDWFGTVSARFVQARRQAHAVCESSYWLLQCVGVWQSARKSVQMRTWCSFFSVYFSYLFSRQLFPFYLFAFLFFGNFLHGFLEVLHFVRTDFLAEMAAKNASGIASVCAELIFRAVVVIFGGGMLHSQLMEDASLFPLSAEDLVAMRGAGAYSEQDWRIVAVHGAAGYCRVLFFGVYGGWALLVGYVAVALVSGTFHPVYNHEIVSDEDARDCDNERRGKSGFLGVVGGLGWSRKVYSEELEAPSAYARERDVEDISSLIQKGREVTSDALAIREKYGKYTRRRPERLEEDFNSTNIFFVSEDVAYAHQEPRKRSASSCRSGSVENGAERTGAETNPRFRTKQRTLSWGSMLWFLFVLWIEVSVVGIPALFVFHVLPLSIQVWMIASLGQRCVDWVRTPKLVVQTSGGTIGGEFRGGCPFDMKL